MVPVNLGTLIYYIISPFMHFFKRKSYLVAFFLCFRVSATPLTAGGQDFVPKEIDVTFAPGETGPKSIEIGVTDDETLENREAFQMSLISSSVPAVKLGQPSSVNIVDNDGNSPPQFSQMLCLWVRLFYHSISSILSNHFFKIAP